MVVTFRNALYDRSSLSFQEQLHNLKLLRPGVQASKRYKVQHRNGLRANNLFNEVETKDVIENFVSTNSIEGQPYRLFEIRRLCFS